MLEPRVGEQLIQQQVLLAEAEKLGIHATDDDLKQALQKGQFGELFFPNGQYVGDEKYKNIINSHEVSVTDFEDEVRQQIAIHRLEALITAGVTVSNQEVRDDYRKGNIKIKFDYAVISSDELSKGINPADSELASFFKTNAARYASAVPEERKITYFAFTPNELPGGVPQVSQQEIQQYFNAHQAEYQVDEQARSRHILIQVSANADAKTDAAAKAKAEGILKQIQAAATLPPWPRQTPTTRQQRQGRRTGFCQARRDGEALRQRHFHPEDRRHADCQKQFWISHCAGGRTAGCARRVDQRSAAHHSGHAGSPEGGSRRGKLRTSLTSEATQNGLEKTAAAHHLELVTTPMVGSQGVIAALPDGSQVIAKLPGQAERFAAICSHRRGIRNLPGYGDCSGSCADV